MSTRLFLLFAFLLALVDSSHQMADSIRWKTLKTLTPEFLNENQRPIMVLIHKSWSPPCRMLVDELHDLSKSKDVKALSEEFVMVNVVDSEEPSQNWLSPDGVYYPRILFLSPSGEIQPQFTCSMNMHPQFKYYYSSAVQVSSSMQRVLLSSAEKLN